MRTCDIIQSFCLSILALTIIVYRVYCHQCETRVQFNINHLHHRLYGSGYAIGTYSNTSLHMCARKCMLDTRCKSINHMESQELCDLNSINASEASVKSLLQDTNWNYFNIEKWIQLFAPSCNEKTTRCPENHRCLRGDEYPYCVKINDTNCFDKTLLDAHPKHRGAIGTYWMCSFWCSKYGFEYTIPKSCPDDFYPFNDKCFYLSSDGLDWYDAQASCIRFGAKLPTQINATAKVFLDEMIKHSKSVQHIVIVPTALYNKIWLHDEGVDIKRRTSITVNITTCTRVAMYLSNMRYTNDNETLAGEAKAYAIVIDIEKTYVTVNIFNVTEPFVMNYINRTIVPYHLCGTPSIFWLRWSRDVVRIGTGSYVDENELVVHNLAIPIEIKHLAIASLTYVETQFLFWHMQYNYYWTGTRVIAVDLDSNDLHNETMCVLLRETKNGIVLEENACDARYNGYMCEIPIV